MKKLLTMAGVAAVLACWTPGAKASIGITTNHTPVNISIVVTTNGVEKEPSSDVYTEATGQAKISNSTLMKIFAHWAGVGSWPAGAKLEIGWDEPWDGDVLVVGSSGTNVLFDADESGHTDTYFYVDYVEEYEYDGAYSYTEAEKDPGSESENEGNYGYFEFEDDDVYLPYTYLEGYGYSKISYTESWNADDEPVAWTQTTDLDGEETSYDDMSYLDQEYYITVKGSVNASGSGKHSYAYYGD